MSSQTYTGGGPAKGEQGGISCIGCHQHWPSTILNYNGGCPACGPDPRTATIVKATAELVLTTPHDTRAAMHDAAKDYLNEIDGVNIDKARVIDTLEQRVKFHARLPIEHRELATDSIYVDDARTQLLNIDRVERFCRGEVVDQ